MRQAKIGDTVRVHYTGTLSDGTEFDSSPDDEPFEVTIGSGQVVKGFDSALVGMAEGERKSTILQPAEAFGARDPSNVHSVFEAEDSNGNPIRLQVLEFSDRSVTFDANHPLAGRTLTFELNLVEFVC